jgi:hypothetical protein
MNLGNASVKKLKPSAKRLIIFGVFVEAVCGVVDDDI